MKFIGCLCLIFGLEILILSYPGGNQVLPSWTSIFAGILLTTSYLLAWRE